MTKYSYAMYEGTGLFIYTSRERRDAACAECKGLDPVSAVRARIHMREALVRELWARPDEFGPGGWLQHQDKITDYYAQMVEQLG